MKEPTQDAPVLRSRGGITITRRQALWIFGGIFFFALILRVFVAMSYRNSFDTEWYITWANGLQNGFFNAYDGHVGTSSQPLDYPPLYLFCLKLVGMVLRDPAIAEYWPFRMMAIKFFPILFDMLTIAMLYLMCKKRSPVLGVLLAAVWAVNPSAVFNCAAWGQTDTIMIFQLAVAFWALEEERPVLGAVLYGLAVLTKMQCLYFAPVILFLFIRKKQWMALLKALAAGAGTLLAVFLPFMIGCRDAMLPIKVYTQGFGSYPYINLNAFNLWGLGRNNWVTDSKAIFGGAPNADGLLVGGFTFSMLSMLLMVGAMLLVFWTAVYGKRHCVWLDGLLLMQCLFMLTTRQHERYQIIVIIFCLVAFIRLLDFRLLGLFIGLSFTTFMNQVVLLTKIHDSSAAWVSSFETIQALVSAVNVALFLWNVYICIQYAFGEKTTKQIPEPSQSETSRAGDNA